MNRKSHASSKASPSQNPIIQAYQKRSDHYDNTVGVFNLFRSFGFDIPGWRFKAVQTLDLKPGDKVVDVGCGTGLNFPLIQKAIGPDGHLIGVDLSESMLAKAQQRVLANGWQNVELVCADAAQYEFPPKVDGVLSTFALILVPECEGVINNGCQALRPGGHYSVLDMCWPASWSFGWRHVFFFLRSYGVTLETLERRPWQAVWEAMDENLVDFTRNRFWFGMMYQASGKSK